MSVEAVQETETEPDVVAVTCRLPGVEGGVVSAAHAAVVAVTLALAEWLPAASTASIATVSLVLQARPVKVVLVPLPVETTAPFK